MNKNELLNISQHRKTQRKKDRMIKTERQTYKTMNDDEQDSEDIKMISDQLLRSKNGRMAVSAGSFDLLNSIIC